MRYTYASSGVPERMHIRGTVLVIDDDEWIRSVIADFLTDEGFAVEQAGDGTTGLRLAEQAQPDVILLDLALPMQAGLQVLHRLKEQRPTRDIPIIIVSTYALLLVRDEVVRANRLLQKPLELKELLDDVNHVVSKAHADSAAATDTQVGLNATAENLHANCSATCTVGA